MNRSRESPAPLTTHRSPLTIEVIDSHTGGEPTRVVVGGGPELGNGSIAERARCFRDRCVDFRRAVVCEPRGSDVIVGALLCPPSDPSCASGVIYFNNVGTIGMCGHGTIGVAVTLAHLGRLAPGTHRLETPVGIVSITLEDAHHVAIDNVPSYRLAANVAIPVPDAGIIHGDVAWGGNWFFLVADHGQDLSFERVDALTEFTWRIRRALREHGVTGAKGAEIDHIELFGPPISPGDADSKNFVLCPGGAYDRSPCGTGTSAKLACLVADGKFSEGDIWRQESIVGSIFEGSVRIVDGVVHPRIRGSAFVTARASLILDPDDPFRCGLREW